MTRICDRLSAIREHIHKAEKRFGRPPGSVRLLAVSKTQPPAAVREALGCDQVAFGESYAQELAKKCNELAGLGIEWHFIGPIQSNKTRLLAAHAHWVHSIDRLKIAQRLDDQRPEAALPLQVCLQVNLSRESSKSGVELTDLPSLAEEIGALSRLRLRGLMAIPAPSEDFDQQRRAFADLRKALEGLNERGHRLDTLSMGMTRDLEAAIAEGATIVRVGTGIFGAREYS